MRGATVRKKTLLGIFQFRFNYFAASFLKPLGINFSRMIKERNVPIVNAFPLVSFLVCGDNHPSLPIFQNARSLDS